MPHRPISAAMPGLLSLLDLKVNGRNPEALNENVAPVMELLPFLLQGSAQNFLHTVQTVNNPFQQGAYGHAAVVPPGELWWVHSATFRIGVNATVTAIAIRGAQVIVKMPNPDSEIRGAPFSLEVAAAGVADQQAELAPASLMGFWAPGGSTIYGSGAIDILDGGGATLFTCTIDVRYTPVRV